LPLSGPPSPPPPPPSIGMSKLDRKIAAVGLVNLGGSTSSLAADIREKNTAAVSFDVRDVTLSSNRPNMNLQPWTSPPNQSQPPESHQPSKQSQLELVRPETVASKSIVSNSPETLLNQGTRLDNMEKEVAQAGRLGLAYDDAVCAALRDKRRQQAAAIQKVMGAPFTNTTLQLDRCRVIADQLRWTQKMLSSREHRTILIQLENMKTGEEKSCSEAKRASLVSLAYDDAVCADIRDQRGQKANAISTVKTASYLDALELDRRWAIAEQRGRIQKMRALSRAHKEILMMTLKDRRSGELGAVQPQMVQRRQFQVPKMSPPRAGHMPSHAMVNPNEKVRKRMADTVALPPPKRRNSGAAAA